MKTPTEIREFVQTLRELGVLEFEQDGVRIKLGAQPETPPAPFEEKPKALTPVLRDKKYNLTAEEQMDFFGVVDSTDWKTS